MVRRHEADIVVDLRHALVIAGEESGERLRHEPAHLLVEPSHNPEIHGDDPALLVHEQVSRMHVGMEKAVA